MLQGYAALFMETCWCAELASEVLDVSGRFVVGALAWFVRPQLVHVGAALGFGALSHWRLWAEMEVS